jgi:hypothetical protein
VTTASIAICAVGGTVTFVSGVAAGVANGMARHEHLKNTLVGAFASSIWRTYSMTSPSSSVDDFAR